MYVVLEVSNIFQMYISFNMGTSRFCYNKFIINDFTKLSFCSDSDDSGGRGKEVGTGL